ncbi:MAG: hypothetical protein ILP13_02720, partial [Lachnospiraceae bacterium]|nr:hypothetical protein [Lachnospiraceae bacterium]
MNETKKRKEWIKNFAIIFLAILLVLTFCSNTIMNYSLPEVAAQYCYSGEITNKVRGNGTVEAEDPYKVIFKQSRKVDSVVARVGDMVEKGDVLFKLEAGDSEELKELKKQLEEYLIKNELSDAYAGVVDGKKDSDFEANLEKVKAARKKVENLEKAVANTEAALEKFKNGTAEQYAEYKALADAKATKQAWDTQHGYNSTNLEAAKATFNYDTLKSAYDVALNDYNMAKADYDAKLADYNAKAAAEATAQAEKDAAQDAIT